ncbi:MAG: AzlC family ABC transporter permease [Dethiobacteria bacterium]|jgi:4-azaleucine resistance transporter AzlC|nr:AzlC family ABC transporter permease [Bacillota bacterium]
MFDWYIQRWRRVLPEVVRGAGRALPVVFGYLPVGFAYGVLASQAGLTLLEAVLMSVFVYAGSAQLIAAGLIAAGANTATITATTFLVNLRHMLMSAALAPYLGHLSRPFLSWFAFEITDESFAVHTSVFAKDGVPGKVELLTINLVPQLAWIASSFFGAWTGTLLADTKALALDYALPAMFIALLMMQIVNRLQVVIAVLAASASVFFYLFLSSNWNVILATVIAATIGVFCERWMDKFSPSSF